MTDGADERRLAADIGQRVALIEGVVRSVLRHGFRRIVLLNAHGGTAYGMDADLEWAASDALLQRAARVASARALDERAQRWRPWSAYAALHLMLRDDEPSVSPVPLVRLFHVHVCA